MDGSKEARYFLGSCLTTINHVSKVSIRFATLMGISAMCEITPVSEVTGRDFFFLATFVYRIAYLRHIAVE